VLQTSNALLIYIAACQQIIRCRLASREFQTQHQASTPILHVKKRFTVLRNKSATDGYALRTEDASVERAFGNYVAKAADEKLVQRS